MKKVRSILLITILVGIVSCHKEDEKKTTYSFRNNSSFIAYEVTTWGTGQMVNQGTIDPGEETEIVETKDSEVHFSFSFDPGGIKFVNRNPFILIKGTHNTFICDDNTGIYGGTVFYIVNGSSYMLYGLASFYWTGFEILDWINFGNLSINFRTVFVRTSRYAIDVCFYLYPGGPLLVTDYPFIIDPDIVTYLYVDDEMINNFMSEAKSTSKSEKYKMILNKQP